MYSTCCTPGRPRCTPPSWAPGAALLPSPPRPLADQLHATGTTPPPPTTCSTSPSFGVRSAPQDCRVVGCCMAPSCATASGTPPVAPHRSAGDVGSGIDGDTGTSQNPRLSAHVCPLYARASKGPPKWRLVERSGKWRMDNRCHPCALWMDGWTPCVHAPCTAAWRGVKRSLPWTWDTLESSPTPLRVVEGAPGFPAAQCLRRWGGLRVGHYLPYSLAMCPLPQRSHPTAPVCRRAWAPSPWSSLLPHDSRRRHRRR